MVCTTTTHILIIGRFIILHVFVGWCLGCDFVNTIKRVRGVARQRTTSCNSARVYSVAIKS